VAETGTDCANEHRYVAAARASLPHQASPENPTAMPARAEELSEILHGLNNVLVSILLNAQIMEWKLPSYSRMRRNTHEIQRSAQRAGVLLKRLAGHSGATHKPAAAADSA
jgi:hypothetical protein